MGSRSPEERGTIQGTLGTVFVNKYTGDEHTCDKCMGIGENGKPQTCSNTASYVIHRKYTGISEFFCKMHSKDSWQDIVENKDN